MNRIAAALLVMTALSTASISVADTLGRDAGKHFQRGVELYNDGDFRGALVEFKRAYGMLPRASVLYDIGETEFQLQDYAGSLTTMRRFLSETGPSAPHRAEVEAAVETLRNRVGKITLTVDVPHCAVSIDEQAIGNTPLVEPVLVSIGQRKLVVTCPDRPVANRRVDVAAGEFVRVDVQLGPSLTQSTHAAASAPKASPESVARHKKAMLVLTWTSTTLLVAATVGIGASTLVESSQLDTIRHTYPIQSSTIDSKASLTKSLSIATDVLGVAALAAVGVSTYVTLKFRKGHRDLAVAFAPGGLSVKGTF